MRRGKRLNMKCAELCRVISPNVSFSEIENGQKKITAQDILIADVGILKIRSHYNALVFMREKGCFDSSGEEEVKQILERMDEERDAKLKTKMLANDIIDSLCYSCYCYANYANYVVLLKKIFASSFSKYVACFLCRVESQSLSSIMVNELNSTGYGPRQNAPRRFARLIFDGDERNYEQWEIKFLGYMKLRDLKTTILADGDVDASKNEEAFAELIQHLDDKSLSLIMRDAVDNGREALKILRAHYVGTGKPRIISLYTELTSLVKSPEESVTDYVIRAEKASTALKNAGEIVNDSLLIAMVLKGLLESFKPFVVVVTQHDKTQTFAEFKVALRSFEDTERSRIAENDSIMKLRSSTSNQSQQPKKKVGPICFKCSLPGYIARNCSMDDKRKSAMWCSTCRSGSHNDRSCRKQKGRKTDQLNKVAEDEVEHSFYLH